MDEAARYSDRDLAKIAVAREAASLADHLHRMVGKYGHDVPPGTWLGELMSPVLAHAAKLQGLTAAYERALGTSWEEIAKITGLDDAEARWRDMIAGTVPEDIGAAVTELDHWYVRHMWLADADRAHVPDPVSRLLDAHADHAAESGGAEWGSAGWGGAGSGGAEDACLVCRKYRGGAVPAWAGRAVPPGGHLIDDAYWRAGHAPTVFAPCGSLLVESKRHFLDHAEMTNEEGASYTRLIGRLTIAIKQLTAAERVHVYSSMDGAPHFHVWLVPRRPDDVKGRGFIVRPGYCTDAAAEAIIAGMRAVLADDGDGA
jgi:diadenosine tetraphosphate (Ap4A) HIT family hydrolase